MKLRMLRVLCVLVAFSLVGLFALSLGAERATAVTGSDIYAVCRGWPGKTEVHWDKEWWLKNYGVTVTRVDMRFTVGWDQYEYRDDVRIEGGNQAKIITPLFAGQVQILLYLSKSILIGDYSYSDLVSRPKCSIG